MCLKNSYSPGENGNNCENLYKMLLNAYLDKKPSKWKNEIYKTVAPDRSREERHDMISTHTCFCDRDAISGGFPWFIISISAWQIGYFFWMYGKADPPIG